MEERVVCNLMVCSSTRSRPPVSITTCWRNPFQTHEAHAWDVKKRGEVLQNMVEDVVENPTVEPSHREPLLETAKTLCTDLQDLYRTIRVVLKTQTPDHHTAVWKKSSRSRK